MLEAFRKNKEQQAAKEADELLTKGLAMLDGKMHKQAMITMQKAIKVSPESIRQRLSSEFGHYNSRGDYESALAIGLLLIKLTPKDYELANTLGNCARRQGNYKQANNLYRHCLKVNKKYQIAFYNLAASMGKVQKYDGDVTGALYQFKDIRQYILPDYMHNPQILEQFTTELAEFNETERTLKLEQIENRIEEATDEGELLEVKQLEAQREKLKMDGLEPRPEQVVERFQSLIKRSREDAKEEDEVPGHIFNLGLYCLSVGDGKTAYKQFNLLKEGGHKIEYLDMCIALCKDLQGHTEEAIDEMVRLLGVQPSNRYLNVNMGLMYRKQGNRLLSTKYLLVGASLLEKSDGLYRLSDLIRIAEESMDQGKNKKALKLYQIISTEIEGPEPWLAMGDILLQMERIDDSAEKFKKALEIDPKSELAEHKLKHLHDIYFDRADSFYRDNKYKPAAGLLEKAMRIMKTEETIRQAAAIYKLLKDPKRHDELMEEYEDLKKLAREREQEVLRQEYILKGRAFLARKQFNNAIENFELAFRMKLDKDVFMFLATIYKKLGRQMDMQDLLNRYNKMIEHDERMRKYETDKKHGREAQLDDKGETEA